MKKREKEIEFVLAVIQGVIVGVYKPEEWKQATVDNIPEFHVDSANRIGFIGTDAEDSVRRLYIRNRVPIIFKKRGSKPN